MLSRNCWMSTVMPFIDATMLCVTSAIWAVNDDIFVIVSMVFCISSACLSMLAVMSWLYFSFIFCVVLCILIWNGIDVCSIGVPCGRVIACTREIPGTLKMALATLSITRKSAELRMS